MLVFRTTPEASWQSVLKQVMDTVGALVRLILGAPFLVLIALAIKFTSRFFTMADWSNESVLLTRTLDSHR